jgi:putative aminopeptidase FrvX
VYQRTPAPLRRRTRYPAAPVRADSETFFRDLLEAAGPSGDEREAAAVWRRYASGFADVHGDALGSCYATVNADGKQSVAVLGHIDEIGLVVTHVDDEGYLWFRGVGGWVAAVLVAQRVRILTKDGPITGVVGQKAPHLTDQEERDKPLKVDQLWIDIGAADGDDARSRVQVGDLAVLEVPVIDLAGSRIASRAVDNRAGAFVAAEAARLYAEKPGTWKLVGVGSVGEETSFSGAYTSAFGLDPDAALIIDVTHTSDQPNVPKRKVGEIKLGGGPVIERGSGVHPVMFDLIGEVAKAEGIPVQFGASSGSTGTDADAVKLSRAGIRCGVVSVPNRYMHSPNEIVDLGDLEAVAALIAAVARRLDDLPTVS